MPTVGSHLTRAKQGGVWKAWSNFWAKHAGVWKKPLSVHVKSGGSWVKVWDERPSVTGVSTSWFTDYSDFLPVTYYFKNFTISANGFDTTLTGTSPSGSVNFSQTSVTANNTVGVSSSSAWIGEYNPSNMHTVTATNVSGNITF